MKKNVYIKILKKIIFNIINVGFKWASRMIDERQYAFFFNQTTIKSLFFLFLEKKKHL